MRVAIADPDIDIAVAREVLLASGAEPIFQTHGWTGHDVAGIVLSPANRLDADDLARCPNLQIVVTTSTGYDNIDVDACRQRGIPTWRPSDYCSSEVADSAIAHIVGLLRGVTVLDRTVAAGHWHFGDAGVLHRFDTTRLGVLGFGTIGRKVAARARALGMRVLAYDPAVGPAEFDAAQVQMAGLEELFSTCTAITIHVPLIEGTRGLVTAELLNRLPQGAVLANLARGEVVDVDAVVAALEDGTLAAASLDVLAVEPPTQHNPIPHHPRLVVTPHAAWYSEQSAHTLFIQPLEIVRDVLAGAQPPVKLTQ